MKKKFKYSLVLIIILASSIFLIACKSKFKPGKVNTTEIRDFQIQMFVHGSNNVKFRKDLFLDMKEHKINITRPQGKSDLKAVKYSDVLAKFDIKKENINTLSTTSVTGKNDKVNFKSIDSLYLAYAIIQNGKVYSLNRQITNSGPIALINMDDSAKSKYESVQKIYINYDFSTLEFNMQYKDISKIIKINDLSSIKLADVKTSELDENSKPYVVKSATTLKNFINTLAPEFKLDPTDEQLNAEFMYLDLKTNKYKKETKVLNLNDFHISVNKFISDNTIYVNLFNATTVDGSEYYSNVKNLNLSK